MSLGDDLVDKLKRGTSGPIEVTDGDVRATAEVGGSGPYGAELRGLKIERTSASGRDVAEATERAIGRITERVQYLPERLEALEVDAASGRGILRTRRSQVRNQEYYEVDVQGGDRVDVHRYRFNREAGKRERVGDNLGHRVIGRLVDDLVDVVGNVASDEDE